MTKIFTIFEKRVSRKVSAERAMTLVEVLIAAMILGVAFTGFFLTGSQCLHMLDNQRQTSRAEDICLANMEFLRTSSWSAITNLVTTSGGSTTSQLSSNLIESISMTVSNNPVCTHLVVVGGDPLHIGLRNAVRDLTISPFPVSSTQTVVTATVMVSYSTYDSRSFTNSLTTRITMSGMTATVP